MLLLLLLLCKIWKSYWGGGGGLHIVVASSSSLAHRASLRSTLMASTRKRFSNNNSLIIMWCAVVRVVTNHHRVVISKLNSRFYLEKKKNVLGWRTLNNKEIKWWPCKWPAGRPAYIAAHCIQMSVEEGTSYVWFVPDLFLLLILKVYGRVQCAMRFQQRVLFPSVLGIGKSILYPSK